MKRKFSIYHFLVALMLSTLILPGFVGASTTAESTGSLTIHKFEQEPGESNENPDGTGADGQTVPSDAEPLDGVTFTITQTHIFSVDSDGNEIWKEVTGTPYTSSGETSGGKVTFENLPLGRYHVDELSGPPHVVLNPNSYYVDIPMTNAEGTDVNYNVHIYPKNETIRGAVTLTKNKGDEEGTLSGVTFDLYKKGKDGTYEKFNTGPLTTEGGKIFVENLPYGDYYFVETATIDGYMLNGEHVEFSITGQGQNKTVSLNNYEKPTVTKEVSEPAVNRGDTVTYTITVELPGDIADYESFVITDTLHANLEYLDGSQSGVTGFEFNKDGQTLTWTADTSSELSPGTVTITFDAQIAENAEVNKSINNEVSINFHNGWTTGSDKGEVPVLVHAGSLTVIKQDGNKNSKKLSGAVFDLKDANGNVIATGTSAADGVVNFGEFNTEELDYGDYQLVETKAPAGYRLLTKPIDFTIGEGENHHVTITVDNFKSGWELPKTGGIGTMLFTFIGLSLMGGASFMFARRRNGEEA